MSNLQQRVVSAIVLAAVVILATWLGGWVFRMLAIAIAAAMFFEWATITGLRRERAAYFLHAALLALPLALLAVGMGPVPVLAATAAAVAVAALVSFLRGSAPWGPFGVAYAALPAQALAFIRGDDAAGLVATFFLYAVVWATDIFAYFVGRAVGGPKLAPAISPGKTWSGAAGGTICAMLAALAIAGWAGIAPGAALVGTALVLSILSQIGDLFESAVKRRFGVKDSSNLIPGHGGVLDRVDGLVVAAIALYVIGLLVSGPARPVAGLLGQ